MLLLDLLKFFSGPWYVYEPFRDASGAFVDFDCVASSGDSVLLSSDLCVREVAAFTGCADFGINVYLRKN